MVYSYDQINAIVDDKTQTDDERITALVNLGLEKLDLSLGIVSHIVGRKYVVMYTNNSELLGAEFNTGNTYCSITLSLQGQRVLPVKHFAVSEHFRHPAYAEFKLESYIGTPINVNGRRYGTLNFTNPEPRNVAFDAEEQQLMIELSEAIGDILSKVSASV